MTKYVRPLRRDYTHEERLAVVERICERVAAGTPINHACTYEDVDRSCLYDWRKRWPEIDAAVSRAVAEAMEAERKKLASLISRDKRAANVQLAYMGVRDPETYGPPTKRVEHSGGTQQVVVQITDAERKAITVAAREKYRARELSDGPTQQAGGDDDDG